MTNESALSSGAQAALAAPPAQDHPSGWHKLAGYVLMIALPVAIWFAPLPLEATPKHAVAIALFMIVAWVTEALELGLTGLIGCYLFWALGVVKVDIAFGGFADHTS